MAEFRLALGGVVDVATPQEMDTAISGLQGHIDRRLQSMKRGGRITWRYPSASFTVTLASGATTQLLMVPASPAPNKIWSVRRGTILGVDDHTSVANMTAAIYRGDPFNSTLTQCVVPGVTIPYFATYGTAAVPVTSNDQLFVSFTASAAITNQNITVSFDVAEWCDDDMEQQFA